MGLLVEYSVKDGDGDEQISAMKTFVEGLRAMGDEGFSYTCYTTDDATRFIAVFEFQDDAAKQRFLNSAPFAAYRESSGPRFAAPPQTTPIARIASTAD